MTEADYHELYNLFQYKSDRKFYSVYTIENISKLMNTYCAFPSRSYLTHRQNPQQYYISNGENWCGEKRRENFLKACTRADKLFREMNKNKVKIIWDTADYLRFRFETDLVLLKLLI